MIKKNVKENSKMTKIIIGIGFWEDLVGLLADGSLKRIIKEIKEKSEAINLRK